MAREVDIAVLGSGIRGIWLSAELVKLGWNVMYIHTPWEKRGSKNPNASSLDEGPFQIGASNQGCWPMVEDFVTRILRPEDQGIAFQILTPHGAIELSGGAEAASIKKELKTGAGPILDFMNEEGRLKDSRERSKILKKKLKELYRLPLAERWILEWVGQHGVNRDVDFFEWVGKWGGEFPVFKKSMMLIRDSLTDIEERALSWAQTAGVNVKRNTRLGDIGVNGRELMGVEFLGAEGFVRTKQIVVAHSYDLLEKTLPKFARTFKPFISEETKKWVWVQCSFKLKAKSKPAGMLKHSSFVMDPYLPYSHGNVGVMKWKEGTEVDTLGVWIKVPFSELKRRSFVVNLTEQVQSNLVRLLPRFSHDLLAVLPFEEYFNLRDLLFENLAIVLDSNTGFVGSSMKFKNGWMCGPEADKGLSLIHGLQTEHDLYKKFKLIRDKELKRDRKVSASRNGEAVGTSKSL